MSPLIGSLAGMSARGYGDLLSKSGGSPIAGAYDALATVTVGATAQSSIVFSGIPNTYTHLQIRFIGASNASQDGTDIRFNSDSGSNYSTHGIYGTGSGSGSAFSITSATNIATQMTMTTTANTFGVGIVDILDYSNINKNKTVRCLTGYDLNGSGTVYLISGAWYSTSAVNSITLFANTGTNSFASGTSISLYGVK